MWVAGLVATGVRSDRDRTCDELIDVLELGDQVREVPDVVAGKLEGDPEYAIGVQHSSR